MDGATVQVTRRVSPPPLPEVLHWVMVALVVAPTGVQASVGSIPPPSPEPMHWLMLAGLVPAAPVMLLTMPTVHATAPPPPLPEPSHWVTDVTSAVDDDSVTVQVGGALAAP